VLFREAEEMFHQFSEILEILGIFALILGLWTFFAYVVASLASVYLDESTVRIVGIVLTLGLFVAIGVASRLVGKRRVHHLKKF